MPPSGCDRDGVGDLLAVVGAGGRGGGVEQSAAVFGGQQVRAVVDVAVGAGSDGGDGRGGYPGPGALAAVGVGEHYRLAFGDGAVGVDLVVGGQVQRAEGRPGVGHPGDHRAFLQVEPVGGLRLGAEVRRARAPVVAVGGGLGIDGAVVRPAHLV